MSLFEKLETLTPEQLERFYAITCENDLDSFLTDTNIEITDEIKESIIEFINTGTLPVSDDVLKEVAGGTHRPADRLISSGYLIRRAQEEARQAAISDKMRSQIKGLDESLNNEMIPESQLSVQMAAFKK